MTNPRFTEQARKMLLSLGLTDKIIHELEATTIHDRGPAHHYSKPLTPSEERKKLNNLQNAISKCHRLLSSLDKTIEQQLTFADIDFFLDRKKILLEDLARLERILSQAPRPQGSSGAGTKDRLWPMTKLTAAVLHSHKIPVRKDGKTFLGVLEVVFQSNNVPIKSIPQAVENCWPAIIDLMDEIDYPQQPPD